MQLANELREVRASFEASRFTKAEAYDFADDILPGARKHKAFDGTLLQRIVNESANIIRAAAWIDDKTRNTLDLAAEIGDVDDCDNVQPQAIIQGGAKIPELIEQRAEKPNRSKIRHQHPPQEVSDPLQFRQGSNNTEAS